MKKPVSLLANVSTSAASAASANSADDLVVRQIALDKILDRPNGDLRELNAGHVLDLAATIADLGLLHPLVLDARNRLLAGKHRLAACRLLHRCAGADLAARKAIFQELVHDPIEPERYGEALEALNADSYLKHHPAGRIPCRLMDCDSEKDRTKAFAAEVAENEKRRDFSPQEVKTICGKLTELGYVRRAGRGQPGKAFVPALALIIGKSLRQTHRFLASLDQPTTPKEIVTPSHLPAMVRAIERGLNELTSQRSEAARNAVTKGKAFLEALQPIVAKLEN